MKSPDLGRPECEVPLIAVPVLLTGWSWLVFRVAAKAAGVMFPRAECGRFRL